MTREDYEDYRAALLASITGSATLVSDKESLMVLMRNSGDVAIWALERLRDMRRNQAALKKAEEKVNGPETDKLSDTQQPANEMSAGRTEVLGMSEPGRVPFP